MNTKEARFRTCQKFMYDNKIGTVIGLRSDEWEEKHNWPSGRYYYHVDFNDGSFITYLSEQDMKEVVEKCSCGADVVHFSTTKKCNNCNSVKCSVCENIKCYQCKR